MPGPSSKKNPDSSLGIARSLPPFPLPPLPCLPFLPSFTAPHARLFRLPFLPAYLLSASACISCLPPLLATLALLFCLRLRPLLFSLAYFFVCLACVPCLQNSPATGTLTCLGCCAKLLNIQGDGVELRHAVDRSRLDEVCFDLSVTTAVCTPARPQEM
jgi:hypothetical protein